MVRELREQIEGQRDRLRPMVAPADAADQARVTAVHRIQRPDEGAHAVLAGPDQIPVGLDGLGAAKAWGEAGYREALRKASEAAQGAPLSDVRADLRQTGILIWRQECLVVTAQAK